MKYIVTMTVTQRDWEADEYGRPECHVYSLKVSMIRLVRAALDLGLADAHAYVRGNATLLQAEGQQTVTLIVGAAGLGRLCALVWDTAGSDGPTFSMTSLEKVDARTRFFKAVAEVGMVIDCPQLKESDIPAWLDRRAESKGVRISGAAKMILLSRVGASLTGLDSELEKLLLFVHHI